MTTQTLLMLLVIYSTITGLIAEAAKKSLDSLGIKYAANLVVLISAILTGGIGTAIFYALNGIPFTAENIIYIAVLVIANWVGAMIGYDKITQLFHQVSGK